MFTFTEDQSLRLLKFNQLLLKFNKVLNLISPKDMDSLESKHISDGVQSFRIFMDIYGNPNEYPAYDLGSGNGIPGLIWAILNQATVYHLVEIDVRKAEFLRHCAREIGLPNVVVCNNDFKTINYPDKFIFIARAFMNIDKLLEPMSPLINMDGFLIKGSTWNHEIGSLNPGSFSEYPYKVDSGQNRSLIHYKKHSKI